ncbi:GSU2403 family nucleotidyltransferase fold protein [Aminobacter anthyllidis]|uniref:nucleotidyltransferase family protein n=1 Tax=Aminobacter anthyllidis TaxID=1035067 RepID=UPI0024545475|nr:GSU2403 family nucleotidyltransferase fold protein [Aminobacter anthyllidis]MDH4985845.1 GSU2403 family nucleotidyltransferase fold protein [Aminobacter anthyllidis]
MNRQLDIAYTTLAAELLERALDAQFDMDFDESGAFIKVTSKGRDYWYYKPSVRDGKPDKRIYVGPVDDPEISKRVTNFRGIKVDFQARRKIVSTLVREGRLFAPERRVGDVVEALWKAGVFRLRACLVGTIAFQTYGTVLGYRFAGAALQTSDIDLAQFHSVSVAVEDSIPPVLDVLREVDETFGPAPALNDALGATRFLAQGGLRVEFLTPNRGSEEYTGKPAKMPALGGAAAEPLRFLDFLIHEPVRTVLLHKGGIPVIVPDPARYAIHKLIVAARRSPGSQKDLKDLRQANQLAEALEATGRADDLLTMLHEARTRGPAWQTELDASLARMLALGLKSMPAILAAASAA